MMARLKCVHQNISSCCEALISFLRLLSTLPPVQTMHSCLQRPSHAKTSLSNIAQEHRQTLLKDLPTRKEFIERSFSYQAADLAELRRKQKEKADQGDIRAKGELTRVKQRQKELAMRKAEALAVIERETTLIVPGEMTFLAHALVISSTDPEDKMRFDADVEAIAVQAARAYEEVLGARVLDVSTAERALAAGLGTWPGFDLLSIRLSGEQVAIEVKGRC